jgi:hypothetical protein
MQTASKQVSYNPTVPSNWSVPLPTNAQEAFDDLAVKAQFPSFLTASEVSAKALNTYDATGLTAGTLAFVKSVQDYYGWEPKSSTTADGINIIAPTIGPAGRWFRRYIVSLLWTQQATWFVDPSNSSGLANDENDGSTNKTPLLTFAELRNRFGNGSFLVSPTITVMSSSPAPASDPIIFNCNFLTGFSLVGVPTTDAAISLGTVTPPQKTGAGAHGWWAAGVSGLTGLFNDNTSNSRFWADAGVLGGAGASTIITVPTAPIASNDSVQLLTLPMVQFGSLEGASFRGIVDVSQLSFTNSIFACEALNATDCHFDSTCDLATKGSTFNNCAACIPGIILAASVNAVLEYQNGYFNVPGGGRSLSSGIYLLDNFTTPDLTVGIPGTQCLYQNDLILGGPMASSGSNTALLAMLSGTSLRANDQDGGGGYHLYGSTTVAGVTTGARLENDTTLIYSAGGVPQLFTMNSDFTVTGRVATRSFDPNTFVASALNIPCSWANLAAAQPGGFGGALQVPYYGILIAPST